MAVYLVNQGKQLLIVTLNSGQSVYLAPGEYSAEIPDQELIDNAKVEKLAAQRALRVATTSPASTGTSSSSAAAAAVPLKGNRAKKV